MKVPKVPAPTTAKLVYPDMSRRCLLCGSPSFNLPYLYSWSTSFRFHPTYEKAGDSLFMKHD